MLIDVKNYFTNNQHFAIFKFKKNQEIASYLKKSYLCRENFKIKIMAEIVEKVQAIIADKLSVDAADVTPEKHFTNDLGADSLDTVELIMEFEKEFGISIPDDQSEKIATVGDAIKFIEERLQ